MKILLINKETNVVEGITYLDSHQDVPKNMASLEIEEKDSNDYMYKKYDFQTKQFSKEKYIPPEPPKELTEVDQLKLQLVSIQEYVLNKEFQELKTEGGLN